jgi:hypothetical protein
MVSHKNHRHKRKNTRKIKGGASFFDPLTKYIKLTSNTNQKIADMQKDKNTISDIMNQLTKTYNNVIANVENLESRIEGLTELNSKCSALKPESTPSTNNSGIFSFFEQEEKPAQESAPVIAPEPEPEPAPVIAPEPVLAPAEEKPTDNSGIFSFFEQQEKPTQTQTQTQTATPEKSKDEGMLSSLFSDNNSDNYKKITTDFEKIQSQGNEILEKENEILKNIKNPNTFGQTDNTFGQTDNTFSQTDNAFGQTDNALGQTDNPFGQTDNPFSQTDNAFGQTDIDSQEDKNYEFPESNDTDLSNYEEEKKKGGKRKSRKYKKCSKKITRKYY